MKNLSDDFEKMQEVIDNLRLEVQSEREKHRSTWAKLKHLEYLTEQYVRQSQTLVDYLEVLRDE